MASWYIYSLAALLLLGTQRFLYKVAAERRCSSSLTTTVFMGTVTLLSGAVFLGTDSAVQSLVGLAVLALVNSASFAVATIGHIEALRHLPAGIVFPLTRLSLIVVVIVSIIYFEERLNPAQWLGVLAGAMVVAVLAREARGLANSTQGVLTGFLCVTACILCGAIAAISSKLAAVSTSKSGFMALSYLLGTCFSLVIERKWGRAMGGSTGDAIGLGVLMGILNFFGFYAFLTALESGPLSVIALVTGMHFVIAIILSCLLYRERLTLPRAVGIGLTLLAIILLKK